MSGETLERARGRWREILPRLGIETRYLTNKHGPCPLCGGKDRYRFDDRNGEGTYICGQCGAGAGLLLVRKKNGWDFRTAVSEIDKIIGHGPALKPKAATKDEDKGKARRLKRVERIIAEATDNRVVDAFLRERRLSTTSFALRGHPACPYFVDGNLVGKFPAVVAPIQAADGSLESAALIYGSAAPDPRKKFMPAVNTISGSAVRLFEPKSGHLGVAEGIATAIAVHQLFGVPTWAALSASGIKSWWPPEGVTRVTVYADNDSNHVGPAAAYDLAQRLGHKGIAAEVQMPMVVGTDFADLLPDPKEPSR